MKRIYLTLLLINIYQVNYAQMALPTIEYTGDNGASEANGASGTAPTGWYNLRTKSCTASQTPDIQPGQFGVTRTACDGNDFAGFQAGLAGADYEGIGVTLPTALTSGATYSFSFCLIGGLSYLAGSNITKLQIRGDDDTRLTTSGCAETSNAPVLLGTFTPTTSWTTVTCTFTASFAYTNLFFTTEQSATAGGNLGIDGGIIILPISLENFETNLTNDAVELSWQTSSEKNNDYFTVEKSLDGIDWKEVTKIDGAGNSSNLLSYRAIDLDPSIGVSYYRVKQTDFDGKTSYSETKSIYNFDGFIALPNPTDGIFGIGGLKHRTEKNIIVTDLMGKVIQQQITREESIQIDLSSNPSGVYLVHIDEYEPVKIVKK